MLDRLPGMGRRKHAGFNVELNRNGGVLDEAHTSGVRRINSALILAVITLASVDAGLLFRDAVMQSPFLRLFGWGLAFLFLAGAFVLTAIWWFLVGSKGPFLFISSQFPFGSESLQAAVCLLPMTMILMIIAVRTYNKVFVPKIVGLALMLFLMASVAALSFWLSRLL